MNTLRLASRVSRLGYSGIEVKTFEVKPLAMESLYLPVRSVPAFAEGIKESIQQEGLTSPVVVVPISRDDLVAHYEARGVDAYAVPECDWLLCVCGGRNRIEAAQGLGYTSIDCLIVPDFDTAIRVQERQRNDYRKQQSA